ncbi:MAG: NAD-dependent epimerase/dehydratase family protein, partial [Cyclobacteriaceae bacterium]
MKRAKTRRQFLNSTLKTGVILPLVGPSLISRSVTEITRESANKKLNILILGGTSFLGPHQIAYAMGRGHAITTFTRGRTKSTIHQDLFKNVEQLIGDRSDNLEALRGRKWDAVIDNSGHREQWTRDTAQLLKDNVGLYLYTSSTGVYYPYLGSNIKENTDLVLKMPEDLEDEDEKMEYGYGVMKSNSEIAARESFGEDRTIIVRPTYMVGPADRLDRFIYWPVRLSRGGEILVPGKSDDPVQYIDVRDVAAWMIRLIEKGGGG